MKWKIRQEKTGDEAQIADLTRAAFDGKSYADGTEATIAQVLRDRGALVLSLVATHGKDVIGHVALSPAKIGDVKCLALGPLAVTPKHQGMGIGSALANHALAVAGAYGRGGVVLMGDPAFYSRLGFEVAGGLTYKGQASPHLQIFGFEIAPVGDVVFHAAFSE